MILNLSLCAICFIGIWDITSAACAKACKGSSDCHDSANIRGLNKSCGSMSCVSGTCQFEAWNKSGTCSQSNFLECAGVHNKCTKGPSGLKYAGTCTGYGNNECIYKWCLGDVVGSTNPPPTTAAPPTTTAPPPTTTAPPPATTAPPPAPTPPSPTPPATGIWRPKPGTSWQWQLTGTIDTSINVNMYDIDLFDAPQSVIDKLHSDGRKVVCYMSAGSFENWRPDASSFGQNLLGSPVGGWPNENWLDIRNIAGLGPIMKARFDLAVSKKCDAIEPDNIDGYQNSNGFGLTSNDQLVYNRWLAAEAHKRGLSIGLKNDLAQVTALVGDFDFAVNEECHQFNVCELLLPFVNAGKAVFGVEYVGTPSQFCPKLNSMKFSWLKKDLDLGASRTDCAAFP